MEKVILVGSPNVGKSSIFNKLTDQLAIISNYPGTTVDISKGYSCFNNLSLEVFDTPGMYSLYPITEEENVTRRFIKENPPKWLIHVVDAKHLTRMLPLTIELIELGFPVILVINMLDEARKLKININLKKLKEKLQIPVIGTIATKNIGIRELRNILFSSSNINKNKRYKMPATIDYDHLHNLQTEALYICQDVVIHTEPKVPWAWTDAILLSPITGFPIVLIVLYFGIYQFVGLFGAGFLVDFLDNQVFLNVINPWFNTIISHIPSPATQELLGGDYGIITLGFRYALAIILPIVSVFFFVFAFLEDSGYLPRLSLMLDRLFKLIGLSGRGVIPIVLGFGCGTMATVVTRTLETRRERVITTFLLAFTIPCSAQLGLIMAILSHQPLALLIWGTSITIALLWAGSLLNYLLPGIQSSFYMEIPPLRVPNLENCFLKTVTRLRWYVLEIFPIFVSASFLIWIGKQTKTFDYLISLLEKIVVFLGLPTETAIIFLYGFFRRDYGTAGLYDLQDVLTWPQLTIASVVLTLFVPCVAQFIVIIKEQGISIALLILTGVVFAAFSFGFLLRLLLL